MAGGEVDAHPGAERDTRDVGLFDSDGVEEGGGLVGIALGRVRPGRLVALARARKVERDAAEVLGIRGQLKRVAGVIGGQIRDQQQRLAVPLHVVVEREFVYLDLWHARTAKPCAAKVS
jgi:hypothetical protein